MGAGRKQEYFQGEEDENTVSCVFFMFSCFGFSGLFYNTSVFQLFHRTPSFPLPPP